MNINNNDFVLEIGSGDNPNPHSHVLVDKFFEPTHHRKNTPMKIDNRPVIVGDAEKLPFKDRSFDYVICSHLIEHIPDVEQAFRELTRVAKAGYIETPSIYAERIVGKHDIHLWNIYSDGHTLFLNRKTKENISPFLNPEIYDSMFADFFWSHASLFFIRYEWKGTIDYAIISDEEMVQKYFAYHTLVTHPITSADQFDPHRLRFAAFLLKRELTNLLRTAAPSIVDAYYKRNKERSRRQWQKRTNFTQQSVAAKLNSVLCCPHCHSDLNKMENGYQCISCDIMFKNKQGVPNFL